MRKVNLPGQLRKMLLIGLVSCTALSIAGCPPGDTLSGDDDRGDVCLDISNQFVTQWPNGLGVTSEDCVASERGQLIEGRCYCHGEGE